MQHFLDEMQACVPALRRYARGLTRNTDLADDLVQDCLERAIRKQRLWRPVGPLQAWLFKVLLNLYRNDARQRRRRGESVPIDALAIEPSVPASQHARLALAEINRALGTLPDEQREALLLVVLEGVSYAEAAAIIGVPIGTLMSRLGRARSALRTIVGAADEPRLRTVK